MSKIKLTSYVNFILYIALILSPILTIAMGVLCHFISEVDDNIILYAFLIMGLLQIPTAIFLMKRFSIQRDYFVTENEVIQNNIVICKRKDIISIKRINFLKTEIKYLSNGAELVIFANASKKKIGEVKQLLAIYD